MSSDTEALNQRILVIDSNVFFARRLTEALKAHGFDVIHTTQPTYALTMLEWNAPTAILCATNLRELSVFDLPDILHSDAATTNIPILAMGDGGEQSLMEAFRAGCDDYIDRRRGPENIAAQVRTFLLSRLEGFHPTQMLESEQTVLEGSLSHLDLPGVIQMLAHSRQSGVLYINAESHRWNRLFQPRRSAARRGGRDHRRRRGDPHHQDLQWVDTRRLQIRARLHVRHTNRLPFRDRVDAGRAARDRRRARRQRGRI